MLGAVVAGRYRVRRLLSSGGMGRVYLAEQTAIDAPVALKVLRPERRGDEASVRRFEREARSASELVSPHNVRIFEFGRTVDEELFIAMEYLPGRTLRARLQAEGRLPVDDTLRILDQTARALGEAHAAGIVHRDLKPANIFLLRSHDYPEFVKVLDFGIAAVVEEEEDGARLTRDSEIPCTPAYVAPERIAGAAPDPRTDVYSLGIVAYELLTGSAPFDGATATACFNQHLEQQPTPLTQRAPDAAVPPGIVDLVMRCLSKSPETRPADGDGFRRALEQARRAPTSGSAQWETADTRRPSGAAEALGGRSKRSRLAWATAAALALATGLALWFATGQGDHVSPPVTVAGSLSAASSSDVVGASVSAPAEPMADPSSVVGAPGDASSSGPADLSGGDAPPTKPATSPLPSSSSPPPPLPRTATHSTSKAKPAPVVGKPRRSAPDKAAGGGGMSNEDLLKIEDLMD